MAEPRPGGGFPLSVAGRLCDLVVPGTGRLLVGHSVTGWGAIGIWAGVVLTVSASVCILGFHPLTALLGLGILYLAFQILLVLERPPPASAKPGPRAALSGLLVFIGILALGIGGLLGRWCLPVSVDNLCGFPGYLPGEVVLSLRMDYGSTPPVAGDLVVARGPEGPFIARVVGLGGDRVALSGPSMVINDAVVESEALGTVRMPEEEDLYPQETRSLRLYREEIGTRSHPFFFKVGVVLAPHKHRVPDDQAFLLCDNRSTSQSLDSRGLGSLPLADLVARPGMVIWSWRPGDGIRFHRIGAVWE